MSIQLSRGALGPVRAADTVYGEEVQRVKPQFGAPGSATDVSADNPLPVNGALDGPLNRILPRFLDTIGDGAGVKNAIGDYSSAQEIFRLAPPPGTIYRIRRLLISILDGVGTAAGQYGAMTALANGVQVRVHNGSSTVVDLTDGVPATTNAGWGFHCFDAEPKEWGSGDEFTVVRWTFGNSGTLLRLDGDANEELQVLLDDNFNGLIAHYFKAEGFTESTPT